MMPRLTKEESQELAKHIVAEMISRLSEEENVSRLAQAWGRQLDQWIGKSFRRLVILVFMFITAALAVKFQVWTHWTE